MARKEMKAVETMKSGTDWKPAVVPTLALIIVGVVPGLLKGLYEPFTPMLMAAYVAFGLSFISLVLGRLAFMAFRDLSDRKTTIFRLAASERPADEEAELVRIKSREDRIE